MIYFDNAATTPLSDNAIKEMEKYWKSAYGNPSSLYTLGKDNKKILESKRSIIAGCINALPQEIYFTSCGTESDNWALKGIAFTNKKKGNHIIVSSIEHHAILNTCKFLEAQGFDITYLPVNEYGEIEIENLIKAIRKETILISIMMVNNEIGTIQNIKKITELAHSQDILFHTDAVQAVGHIPIDVKELGVDMLSCSGHKFNGPKGTGFLYIREGIKIDSLIHGGQQENNLRAGTENIPLIVGMATALKEHIENLSKEIDYISTLKAYMIKKLNEKSFDYKINGSQNSVPGILSISFKDIEGESILYRMDLKEICISTGSACDSINTQLSHVLKAINCDNEYAFGTIRISLSEKNTTDEIDTFIEVLSKILN